MQVIRHLCGQPIERCAGPQGSYLAAKPSGHARVHHVEVQACPTCGESLCDSPHVGQRPAHTPQFDSPQLLAGPPHEAL